MSIFNKDNIKEEKIDTMIKLLLDQLDIVDRWTTNGPRGVSHKQYNLMLGQYNIHNPHEIPIPKKWKSVIVSKIKIIHRHIELSNIEFICDILKDLYPIQRHDPTHEQLIWCKENEVDYIIKQRGLVKWIYIKEGSGAMAFKLKWL